MTTQTKTAKDTVTIELSRGVAWELRNALQLLASKRSEKVYTAQQKLERFGTPVEGDARSAYIHDSLETDLRIAKQESRTAREWMLKLTKLANDKRRTKVVLNHDDGGAV